MNALARLLEERPGVQSSARAIALVLTVLAVLIGATMCFVAIYATVHARQHAEHASAAISAAGTLITQLTLAQGPVMAGIWIALGKRKPTPDDSGVATTQINQSVPVGAPAPSVSITPPGTS